MFRRQSSFTVSLAHVWLITLQFIILLFALSCASSIRGKAANDENTFLDPIPLPVVRFVVAADLHYYSRSLGDAGSAFEHDLRKDRKLLLMSAELLDTAIPRMAAERASFIIICGDMTKDGERLNHELAAARLARLASAVPVFVVPGNHDIANGLAVRYDGEQRIPVPSIGPEEFKTIYRGLGYGRALDADQSSLSYVAEPVHRLWLLALDSCKWRRNKPGKHSETGGCFSRDTERWIEQTLIRARNHGKAVIVFMHHGVLEHYPHNTQYFSSYLIDDFRRISRLFARYGVRLVFTGHFHAQDITVHHFNERAFLADIETGSLITYPCPYRVVTIEPDRRLRIETRIITATSSMQSGFSSYAKEFLLANTAHLIDGYLKRLCVREDQRKLLAPRIAKAYLMHIVGDEPGPDMASIKEGASIGGRCALSIMGKTIAGWQTDFPPSDNNCILDLTTGYELSVRKSGAQ